MISNTKVIVFTIIFCYQFYGDLPPPSQVVDLFKSKGIKKIRLYDPNHESLAALKDSNIEIMLGVTNGDLQAIASNPASATGWVNDNIKAFGNIIVKYVVVGNEVKPTDPFAQFLVPAIVNLKNSLEAAGLNNVKVSTSLEAGALGQSYPPSAGAFNEAYMLYLKPLISFLQGNQSPLLVNIYPYFAHSSDPTHVPLDYALFTAKSQVVDSPHSYQNLFDAMLDAFYSALEKAGGGSIDIVVSETGWPSDGGVDTTVQNAMTFNNNLAQHVKGGTPKRPGKPIDVYIFAMFDEVHKEPLLEKHWGLFFPNKEPKYPFNFN